MSRRQAGLPAAGVEHRCYAAMLANVHKLIYTAAQGGLSWPWDLRHQSLTFV